MKDHLLDLVAGNGEISSRVEDFRGCLENAADTGGHRKADVGVYVYLADCELSRVAEHIFGYSERSVELAAALVDLVDELGNDG